MNKERFNKMIIIKKELEQIYDKLEHIKLVEEEVFDNIPENLQGSERACISEDSISSMDDALCNISNAIENLDEIDY